MNVTIDKVMHLRAYDGVSPNGHRNFIESKRGITVIGGFMWNVEENRQDIIFAWSIQDPRDQYCKKTGIQQAQERLNSGLIVQTNYESRFPLKYQFFNAVANTREYFHKTEEGRPHEDLRFIDLSFFALAEIAQQNDWYLNMSADQIPSIHPDILINFIGRLDKVQQDLIQITRIIGTNPFLTGVVNKSYGV